jgi:hypothetical protein
MRLATLRSLNPTHIGTDDTLIAYISEPKVGQVTT